MKTFRRVFEIQSIEGFFSLLQNLVDFIDRRCCCRFFRRQNEIGKRREGNCDQQRDHRDHNHQFHKRDATTPRSRLPLPADLLSREHDTNRLYTGFQTDTNSAETREPVDQKKNS